MSVKSASAWAEIDLGALVHNFHALKRAAVSHRVIAVVKADAYGHGAVEAARALSEAGADMFAVATVAEGAALRETGIAEPILLMGAFPSSDIEEILSCDLTPSVSSPGFAEDLSRAAAALGRHAAVHVKVDTGMGRLGIPYHAAIAAIERMSVLPGLDLEGIYTHFPSCDEDREFTLRQAAELRGLITALEGLGVTFKYHHAASSAACMDIPETFFDTLRPGLSLYGLRPGCKCGRHADLKPVMEFCARVVHVEPRRAGSTIGYGRTHRLAADAPVAVVSAGYADGYDRKLSGKGVVTIRGKECPVLGRVSMDMISVDVSKAPDAAPGDRAVLFSADPAAPNCVERIAATIDTIPYCLVCGVSSRVKRVYNR
jgi:alanine racemase